MQQNLRKVLKELDEEIKRIRNLHQENLQRLREGEVLSKLPSIVCVLKQQAILASFMQANKEEDEVSFLFSSRVSL